MSTHHLILLLSIYHSSSLPFPLSSSLTHFTCLISLSSLFLSPFPPFPISASHLFSSHTHKKKITKRKKMEYRYTIKGELNKRSNQVYSGQVSHESRAMAIRCQEGGGCGRSSGQVRSGHTSSSPRGKTLHSSAFN